MSQCSKPECAKCDEGKRRKPILEIEANDRREGATLFKAAAAVMATTAHLTTDLAALHAAVERLETAADAKTAPPDSPAKTQVVTIGDGSGAGSIEAYQDMIKRNWHGRLGRTHMVDVDRMGDPARKELDCYLRREIHGMFPVAGAYLKITPNTVFATLSAFGLRLEDRGPLADVKIFVDADHTSRPTLTRLRNFSAHYFNHSGEYWQASAMETLIELARYRGLFKTDGFLKEVN